MIGEECTAPVEHSDPLVTIALCRAEMGVSMPKVRHRCNNSLTLTEELTTNVLVVQNRAFQQVTPGTTGALAFWNAVGGAQISVVDDTPPLSSALPNSLQIFVPSGSSGAVGAANTGFWGEHLAGILPTQRLR
jgi:hypothetical protein